MTHVDRTLEGERTGGGSRMEKFVHICASQNDLFALDDRGEVYQYNFQAKTWVKLISSRADESGECR